METKAVMMSLGYNIMELLLYIKLVIGRHAVVCHKTCVCTDTHESMHDMVVVKSGSYVNGFHGIRSSAFEFVWKFCMIKNKLSQWVWKRTSVSENVPKLLIRGKNSKDLNSSMQSK